LNYPKLVQDNLFNFEICNRQVATSL